jgi:long-chain acyl-CoA synthetase
MSEKELTGYPSIDKPWLKYYSEEAKDIEIPDCSIYDYMLRRNIGHSEDTACLYFGVKIKYSRLLKQIEKAEAGLRGAGVRCGDIVTLSLPAMPETVYLFYAISRIGAVANFIDPRCSEDEVSFYLKESGSSILFFTDGGGDEVIKALKGANIKTSVSVSPLSSLPFSVRITERVKHGNTEKMPHGIISYEEFLKRFSPLSCNLAGGDILPDSPVLMTHTSGTTGTPKGVLLSHRILNSLSEQYDQIITYKRGDKYFSVAPPFIAFGAAIGVHFCISVGISPVLVPQFKAEEFFNMLKKYRIEHFTLVPQLLKPLIDDERPIDLSFLVTPSVGGNAIQPEFEQKVNDYLASRGCSHHLIMGYGMTEAGSSACTCKNNCTAISSAGAPLPKMVISIFEPGTDNELKYNEEGEICFSGPNIMIGYFNNPEATSQVKKLHKNGTWWIHSGDVGYMTPDGMLYVIDRLKRMLSFSDGNKILPAKIESVVNSVDGVEQCVAVGIRDQDVCRSVYAYVVLKEVNCQ